MKREKKEGRTLTRVRNLRTRHLGLGSEVRPTALPSRLRPCPWVLGVLMVLRVRGGYRSAAEKAKEDS
jgi:hypothetical protein